jgi:hypothetical protein
MQEIVYFLVFDSRGGIDGYVAFFVIGVAAADE